MKFYNDPYTLFENDLKKIYKEMKIFLFLLLSVLCFIILDAQVVKQNGQLKVQGTQLVDAKGESIVLHGMSFGWIISGHDFTQQVQ